MEYIYVGFKEQEGVQGCLYPISNTQEREKIEQLLKKTNQENWKNVYPFIKWAETEEDFAQGALLTSLVLHGDAISYVDSLKCTFRLMSSLVEGEEDKMTYQKDSSLFISEENREKRAVFYVSPQKADHPIIATSFVYDLEKEKLIIQSQ